MSVERVGIQATHQEMPSSHASVVTVSGELDLYSLNEFKKVLAEAEDTQSSLIILDLRELGFIDSSGLGAIIGVQGRCQKSSRSLFVVVLPDSALLKTFEVTGLDEIFRLIESPEEALPSSGLETVDSKTPLL